MNRTETGMCFLYKRLNEEIRPESHFSQRVGVMTASLVHTNACACTYKCVGGGGRQGTHTHTHMYTGHWRRGVCAPKYREEEKGGGSSV